MTLARWVSISRCSRRRAARRGMSQPASSWTRRPGRSQARASRRWRTAIAGLSERVNLEWINAKSLEDAAGGELAVSHTGTLTAARVSAPDIEPFLAVSMYAPWRRPHKVTGSRRIFSDASAHRVVSDLSALVGRESGHRILAAGDLNILHSHGERGSSCWASRYKTVFDRMEALGLRFLGPQAPHGRQADPWPRELPRDSKNVPTYHSNRQTPETAIRQLDFVFASRELEGSVRVRALNEPVPVGSQRPLPPGNRSLIGCASARGMT